MSGQERLPIGKIALAKTFAIDWVSENSKTVLAALATLFVVLFCLYQLSGKVSSQRRSDFLEAQASYSAWISAVASDAELFKQLEKPLKRHPELQAKFGSLIAQHCLGLDERGAGLKYAVASLKRTRNLSLPYYTQFSENSLKIVNRKFPEALAAAKNLKMQMEKDSAFWESRDKMIRSGHLLYAYNLLRIASLEREIGSKEGELAAWNELIRNAGWNGTSSQTKTYDPEAYQALARTFQDGEISLIEFVQQRQRELQAEQG
jgi:hypothetical protein